MVSLFKTSITIWYTYRDSRGYTKKFRKRYPDTEIQVAPLGGVIIFGAIAGVPTAIVAGPLFGRYIGNKILVEPPEFSEEAKKDIPVAPIALAWLVSKYFGLTEKQRLHISLVSRQIRKRI